MGLRKHYCKASGGDRIPAELFKIPRVDTVKVLYSISADLESSAVASGLEGEVQFSFQSQRRTVTKNVPTTV